MRNVAMVVLALVLCSGLALAEGVKMEEKVSYGGWPNCVRLSNGSMELVITTDVGPRIIRCGLVNGENLFHEYKATLGQTGGDEWKNYGGHRLWHAPEEMPRTYWPDNEPVPYTWDGATLKLTPKPELNCGIQKELEIALDPKRNVVKVQHRLINLNQWEIELAPWALSVMAPSGVGIFPQEEFRPHPQYLLPARPMVLWHYTQMADPRWTWGSKYILLRQDPKATTKQKMGFLNKQGWAGYLLNSTLFVKRFGADLEAKYPDYGCNTETYTDSDMLEVESLAPLAKLSAKGGKAEHTEVWSLTKIGAIKDDASIDAEVLPAVKNTVW